ncbi:MAG: hypothetical protein ABIP93_21555 [Gemmatimonadaceae bacterium]
MTYPRQATFAIAAAFSLAACAPSGPSAEHKASDSTAVALSTQRTKLVEQLAAQKDSLTRVVLQADDFIMHIDSSVSTVKGMPRGKRADRRLDPLARQIVNRKLVMARVDALVARAHSTAAQLAKANTSNTALRAQLASDSALITDLNTTIQRQTAMIDALSVRIDSLKNSTQQLAATLATVETRLNKAYFVVGREDELVKRGVIVREGGANLLFAHPGRTLQVARTLDSSAFTAVDQRGTKLIPMPDTTRRYRIVSRQSLDDAKVENREKNSFRGNLTIADASKFWAASRYLVVVEQ